MSVLYKSKYAPTHPRAFSNGCVYEHILKAEEKIGRYLLDDEVVHHRDHNKLNNEPSNLIVFKDGSAHSRFHNYGCNETMLIPLKNGSFDCKREYTDQCPKCGSLKSRFGSQCLKCYHGFLGKSVPCGIEVLNSILEENGNFIAVGRRYGVSDNAVRKWCKKYKLPIHSSSYRD